MRVRMPGRMLMYFAVNSMTYSYVGRTPPLVTARASEWMCALPTVVHSPAFAATGIQLAPVGIRYRTYDQERLAENRIGIARGTSGGFGETGRRKEFP